MKVSRAFMEDFASLANRYKWDGRVLEEVKEQTRNSPELKKYWQDLAKAHRAGYEPSRANNWQRLGEWEQKIDEAKRYENEYGRRSTDRAGPHRSKQTT